MKPTHTLHIHADAGNTILRKCTRARIKEYKFDTGSIYILERKNWLGLWYRPAINNHKDYLFDSREEVLKWYYWFKSGKKGTLAAGGGSAA